MPGIKKNLKLDISSKSRDLERSSIVVFHRDLENEPEPDIIERLRKAGFKFGRHKPSLTWISDDRVVI